jgi:hypothetical protein
MNSSINWPKPPYETQYSVPTHTDVVDCVEESLCHIIYSLTGFRASPRALAKMMLDEGLLNTNGSKITDAIAVANKKGLIPYNEWPTPDSFTWDQYYEPLPALLNAKFFDIRLVSPDLAISPLWTQLSFPHPTGSVLHWVEQINQFQYFDSELGNPVKLLNYEGAVVLSSHSIKITSMQFKKQNYKGELRLVLEASNMDQWQALCAIYGVDPTQIDETIN